MFFFSNAGGLQPRIFGFSKKKDAKKVFFEYSEVCRKRVYNEVIWLNRLLLETKRFLKK